MQKVLSGRDLHADVQLAGSRRLALLAVRYGLYIALGLWLLAMSLASEHFLTWLNLLNVARQAAPIIVIAVGMTFVMATAGIDLSVGSLVALTSVLLVAFFGFGFPTAMALIAVLIVGGLAGFANGLFVVLGLPAFVVTLASLTALPSWASSGEMHNATTSARAATRPASVRSMATSSLARTTGTRVVPLASGG